MYHSVLRCIFRDFAVTPSFLDCYRQFSRILNDTLRSVPSSIVYHSYRPYKSHKERVLYSFTQQIHKGRCENALDQSQHVGRVSQLTH